MVTVFQRGRVYFIEKCIAIGVFAFSEEARQTNKMR